MAERRKTAVMDLISTTSSLKGKKKRIANNNTFVAQCINAYILALQDNAANRPKIFVDGERYQPEAPYEPNQTQIHFSMSKEGSPTRIKYKLNCLQDESLLTLQLLLPTYPFLTELRFEFCSLTYDQLLFIHMILQESPRIAQLSLNGNPKSDPAEDESLHLPILGTHLKMYSIQLCNVGSSIATLLHSALSKPDQYIRTLVILNLGCNQLGDEGCAIISDLLRGNRSLQALNISQNRITEQALLKFLHVFSKFALTDEEAQYKRKLRFMSLLNTYLPNAKRTQSYMSLETNSTTLSVMSSSTMVNNHPFVHNTQWINNQLCCTGNNALLHLNISYNDITTNVLEELIEAIKYQKHNFKTGGLKRVIFDSNKRFPDLRYEINKLLSHEAPRSVKLRPFSVA